MLTPRVPASSGAVALGRLQVWALPPLSAQPHGGCRSPQAWPQKSRHLSFNTRIAQHCCRGGPSPRWALWGILQVKCFDFCRANVSHHLGEHRSYSGGLFPSTRWPPRFQGRSAGWVFDTRTECACTGVCTLTQFPSQWCFMATGVTGHSGLVCPAYLQGTGRLRVY